MRQSFQTRAVLFEGRHEGLWCISSPWLQGFHLRTVSVCPSRGWRRAREPTADWALAQCSVGGNQTSFTLWTAQILWEPSKDRLGRWWLRHYWLMQEVFPSAESEGVALMPQPPHTSRTAWWGLLPRGKRGRGVSKLVFFSYSTAVWPRCYSLFLGLSFFAKMRPSHPACVCHRLKRREASIKNHFVKA